MDAGLASLALSDVQSSMSTDSDELRSRIRAANDSSGTCTIVLDDDPTGSQSVQDVPVLTAWGPDDLAWAFAQPSHGFFILTNTRGLNTGQARVLLEEVIDAIEIASKLAGETYSLITRSDSTLRGHFPLETDVVAARAAAAGAPYDALLVAPAYLAAGRITVGDVHYVLAGDTYVPVGQTGYAKDATFGFSSSDLREYIEEKTGGTVSAAEVRSLSLDDIRSGGVDHVRDVLRSCVDNTPVIVNATEQADLDTVVLGLIEAERSGTRVLSRTGPSFVASRFGLPHRNPLTHDEIFGSESRVGPGLIVVGSHVDLTTRQVERLLDEVAAVTVAEVDVRRLLDPATAASEIERCETGLLAALENGDAMLVSSRDRVTGESGHESLLIAQTVSSALSTLTRRIVQRIPLGWVLAKGGITSSDVATLGLDIRRAVVVGQLFPGIVSVWLHQGRELRGLPYIVFAGNVGDDGTLSAAVRILRGERP